MTPRVSLVIPVYDAGPYLRPCLDSIAAQDLPGDDLEVILVDDGSTDGSGEALDAWADGRSGVQVVHQENSGWPGRPRNVGLAASRGRYVFFMDADDVLAPRSLRRLADFADKHDSDVVVPRMAGLGGREVIQSVYARTAVDADRVLVFSTLTAAKLFRRDFLEAQELRFPEGKVRLEDGMFLAQAYLTARRVSVYADHDCYFLRRREDGANISARLGKVGDYVESIATVMEIASRHARSGAEADAIVLDLYARKALRHFSPERFAHHSPRRRRAWLRSVRTLAKTHVPVELERRLPLPLLLRSRFVRHGDVQALEALNSEEQAGREPVVRMRRGRLLVDLPHRRARLLDVTGEAVLEPVLTHLRVRGDSVEVRGEARLRGLGTERLPLRLVVGEGPGAVEQALPTRRLQGGPWWRFEGRIALGTWADADVPPALVVRMPLRGGPGLESPLATLPASHPRPRGLDALRAALPFWRRRLRRIR